MITKSGVATRLLDGGFTTMVLTCLLGVASYFFGQPLAIELQWFWMALGSVCIVAMAIAQFIRARRIQRRDDDLRAILDAVPHILFLKDTDFRYRMVNKEFERAFRLAPGAALGKSDMELFGAELHDRFVAQDRELLASGEARSFNAEIVVDGLARSLESRKGAVADRRGKPRGIVGVAIDVTERILTQRELQDAHERLNIALEAAQMGIWEWDMTTGSVRADRRARDLLGMVEGDEDISAVFARMHPDDVQRIQSEVGLARARGGRATYEFRMVDDSGASRWVEGSAAPVRQRGESAVFIGINRDITERRESELALGEAKARADRALRELEQSRADLDLALGIGGLGVWRTVSQIPRADDLSSDAFLDTVLATDQMIRDIAGFEVDEPLTYRDQLRQLHPDDRDRVVGAMDKAFRERRGAYRDQYRVCGRDGVVRTVDVRCSLSTVEGPDDASLTISCTGIVRDITQEEVLKSNLITKAEEARSAVEAKAQFLAMMSHEVRTPLNGVQGMIDLILDTSLTNDQRGMLQRCRESSTALLTIINDILDFSKIEARKLELEDKPLSLASLIEDVCATFAPEAARKTIAISSHTAGNLPQFIVGDAVRLRQVLTNLTGNAVKFTHQGAVKVDARKDSEGRLRLAVEDTGIGIEKQATKRLFDPFQQADISTARRYGGTGLGLSIVRQLVELMRGSIECTSELGVGSSFVVRLPLKPWTPHVVGMNDRVGAPKIGPGSTEDDELPQAPFGDGRRVLLAEDHPVNREVIVRQLAKLGFECDCAEDGERAWEMLMEGAADYVLLLTDCQMPVLDGYELTHRLRLRRREATLGLPRLRIVALTANALHGEAERCLSFGMDAYLSKPSRIRTLGSTLAEVLQRDPPYELLRQLCGGDLHAVAELLELFVTTTRNDLDAMDHLLEVRDLQALRELAHRLRSACHQVGEASALEVLDALEHLDQHGGVDAHEAARQLCERAKKKVALAVARAHAFIGMHGAQFNAREAVGTRRAV